MNYIQMYRAAFERCYPQAALDIKSALRDGRVMHKVIINSDAADWLDENDIRAATARFNQRGRPVNKFGRIVPDA